MSPCPEQQQNAVRSIINSARGISKNLLWKTVVPTDWDPSFDRDINKTHIHRDKCSQADLPLQPMVFCVSTYYVTVPGLGPCSTCNCRGPQRLKGPQLIIWGIAQAKNLLLTVINTGDL